MLDLEPDDLTEKKDIQKSTSRAIDVKVNLIAMCVVVVVEDGSNLRSWDRREPMDSNSRMYVCNGADRCNEPCPYHKEPHDPFGPYGCGSCHVADRCATTGMTVKCVPVQKEIEDE